MKTKIFLFTILTVFAIFSSCTNYDKKLEEKKQLIIGTWKGDGRDCSDCGCDSVIIQFIEDGTAYLTYVNLQDSLYIDPPCLCTYTMKYVKYKGGYLTNRHVNYYFTIIRHELSCAGCQNVETEVPDTSIYEITDINDSIMNIELDKRGLLTNRDMFYCEGGGVWYPHDTATLHRIN